MSDTYTLEHFQKDTENHAIEILKDDGLYRHIKCTKGGSQVYRFDLITWPGYLAFTGDMGEYVFSRIPDMFDFFGEGPRINPGYWGEKLQAICKNGGYREFDKAGFRKLILEYFNDYKEGFDEGDQHVADLWEAIEDEILSCVDDGQDRAFDAVYRFDFNSGMHPFQDFFVDGVGGTQKYTFHYLWACYAITWAIREYAGLKAH